MWSAPDAHRFPVVQLPIIDSVSPYPPYLPNAIPKELSERLIRAHGDPAVWWVGQFASYLLRPLDPLQEFLVEAKRKLRFHNESPIVGVHIRRTDKVGSEASFHSVEEYFKFVELFFEQEERRWGTKLKRRAFIATDDPSVIEEARRKMSTYEILGDPTVAKTASLSSRYSFDSLRGIVLDIHVLSKCSYLVCTFSSQVRTAFKVFLPRVHVFIAGKNSFQSVPTSCARFHRRVHIRRTDKVGSEASFHSVEEYFKFVELFFEQEERRWGTKLKRRAFIATDDPSVIEEARRKMSTYEILGDPTVAKTASLSSRYSFDSLRGIVLDIHVLSKCSYLVCTFSSQVCRLSYELMQTDHADASHAFKSLDDVWYFGGGQGKESVAVEAHEGKAGEISFQVGDTIYIAGNHWDGMSMGTNKRTSQKGLYPTYKTQELVRVVPFSAISDRKEG
ncbi:unnamed protein product [Cyprideis torosa]|uniref:Uncharacterized protein n=1 Tax=Cyprideis torosa TaxID=163714 RepID=A0A7R8ZS19_9CRUS|nr:unnamed protein product [Cyprideis torosa]CAG0895235.1 unnamed protein product [Cyprideis torosa]